MAVKEVSDKVTIL